MAAARRLGLPEALVLAALAAGGAVPHSLGAQAAPTSPEGFRTEGSTYVSTASGKGSSAQEAEEKARGAALRGLIEGLGKDRLFAEVFTSSPPIGLDFQLLDSSKTLLGFTALVAIKVDDEAVRIVERGPYLAAALAILGKAEAASDEADARRTEAAAAEKAADLGSALRLYGMSADSCRGALELADPVSDPSVFSEKGKRTAPELKKGLAAILADDNAGIDRVEKAQAALAADATGAAATAVADSAIAAADASQALLEEAAPLLSDLGASEPEKLSTLRDRLATQRRALSDSRAALARAAAALPATAASFAADKLEFAKSRLASSDASLAEAYGRVDREIRDPAARRAARAQAIRWTLLHTPREYLALRAYLPFALATGEGGLEASPFAARAAFEGAFPFGGGGVWVASCLDYARDDLLPGADGGDQDAFTQSFDFGIWAKGLAFAGYRWDWVRRVDGESLPKGGAIELGIGGVYEHGKGDESFHRADWRVSLSYELPYVDADIAFWTLVNAGLDAKFRLGDVALLEASVSQRVDEVPASSFASVLSWAIALGFRLPPPFALGLEYAGSYVHPLNADDSLGAPAPFDGGRFKFFLQYSL